MIELLLLNDIKTLDIGWVLLLDYIFLSMVHMPIVIVSF